MLNIYFGKMIASGTLKNQTLGQDLTTQCNLDNYESHRYICFKNALVIQKLQCLRSP